MSEKSQFSTVTCPFCDSADTELFSIFGQNLLSSQYYCRNCRIVFEAVRFDERESPAGDEEPTADNQ